MYQALTVVNFNLKENNIAHSIWFKMIMKKLLKQKLGTHIYTMSSWYNHLCPYTSNKCGMYAQNQAFLRIWISGLVSFYDFDYDCQRCKVYKQNTSLKDTNCYHNILQRSKSFIFSKYMTTLYKQK